MGQEQKSGRELDAEVAERVFGMVWCRLNRRDKSAILRLAKDAPNYYPAQDSDERLIESADNYSSDLNKAARVEDRIRELGRAEAYVWQLIKAHEGTMRFPNTVEHLYPLVFATAEQRCRAALAAIE
jgi:hypothetical protein